MAGNYRILFRRGTRAFWLGENPILYDGEPGYEKDTRKFKIGDGVSHWKELPYQTGYLEDHYPEPPVDSGSLVEHVNSPLPHPVYDNGQALTLLYENAKV